jgi:hypothetical protein
MTERSKQTVSEAVPAGGEPLFFPETSRKEWLVTLGVFLASCAYLQFFLEASSPNLDEGVALQGAERILHGQVLYRDFFSFLTPGSFYWTALLFWIFGGSMRVARVLLLTYGACYSSLTYLLARRVCSRLPSLLAACLLLISALPSNFFLVHNWDSTLWALLALYSATLLLQTVRPVAAFALGTFTAWTFLFEQSKGACLGLALVLAFAWLAWRRPELGLRRRVQWLAAAVGIAWPFLAVAASWARWGALDQMWNDWLWPIHHYSAANAIPYGTIFTSYEDWDAVFLNPSWTVRGIATLVLSPCVFIALLPVLAFGTLVTSLRRLARPREASLTAPYYLLVSSVACGVSLSVALSRRADATHLFFVAPVLFLILPWLIQRRAVFRWLPGAGSTWLVLFLLVSFSLYGAMLGWSRIKMAKPIPTRRGNIAMQEANGGLSYLLAHTRPGQKVFLYPCLALFYFLTDTYSPTRYDYLQPGMHTGGQFAEAIRAVEADQTPLILYNLSFFSNGLPRFFPSTPPAALAEEPMRNLLISRYHPCAVVGRGGDRYVAFWRGDLPCPPNTAP